MPKIRTNLSSTVTLCTVLSSTVTIIMGGNGELTVNDEVELVDIENYDKSNVYA